MLTAARDFVRAQGVTSLHEVAMHLGVSEEVADALMQKWLEKGRIERVATRPKCSACDLCAGAPTSLYRWTGSQPSENPDQPEPGRSVKVPSDCPAGGPSQGQR